MGEHVVVKSLCFLSMLMRFLRACAWYWLLASDMVYASTQGGGKNPKVYLLPLNKLLENCMTCTSLKYNYVACKYIF